jgi:hypothetical protein
MYKTTKTIILIVVCAVMLISVCQFASACQVDEFYNTKGGALAASTPEILIAAIKLEEEGSREKLADHMKSGTVLRLTDNIKVQVLERSVEFKTLKIKLPEENAACWVRDGSLKQLDCN